jgi:PPM family protein phosphatase
VSQAPDVRIEACARTDQGRTRDHNEDTFLVADLTRGTTDFLREGHASVGPNGVVFLVADGMGGAAAGELASAMAADAIYEHLRSTWTPTAHPTADDFIRCLREAVELANDRIHAYAREHPDARGMGTTATVAGVLGSRLYLAQVGDSRAYLIRRHQAVQLTKDQSLMQRLIDAGELTEEQAAQSERRNIILQALGPDPKVRADVTYEDLARGDLLVLCSDGLSGQVKREEIGGVAAEHAGNLAAICEELIDLANARGGPDNITVVVARFDGPGLPESTALEQPGYHTYPLGEPEASDELPVPAAEPPPPVAAPARAVRRSGGPLAMAAAGVVLLGLLFLLYLLLT